MNNLEKMFVYVPTALCDTFRDYHIPGGEHYVPQTDKYANKVVFLQDENSIYTHGELYGSGHSEIDPWQEYDETIDLFLHVTLDKGTPESQHYDIGQFSVTENSYTFYISSIHIPKQGINFCVHNKNWTIEYGWGGAEVVDTHTDYTMQKPSSGCTGWMSLPEGNYSVMFTLINSNEAYIKFDKNQRIVWEGYQPISWNYEIYDGIQFETSNYDGSMFNGLQENDTIKIDIIPQLENPEYRIQYKQGDGWIWTNLDNVVIENNTISYKVSSDTVTEIADRGLIITGQGYDVTRITVIPN